MATRKQVIDDFLKQMESYAPTPEFHQKQSDLLAIANTENTVRDKDLSYMFGHVKRSYQQHARYQQRRLELRAEEPEVMGKSYMPKIAALRR